MAIGKSSVLFLNVATVRQQDFAEIPGATSGVYVSRKSFFDQEWQVAAVIQMRMRYQDRIYLPGCHRQGRPVAQAELLVTLEQAAINQQAFITVAN